MTTKKEMLDLLYTARWTANNKGFPEADAGLTLAIDAVTTKKEAKPAAPAKPKPATPKENSNDKIWEPTFKVVKGVKFKTFAYRTPDKKADGLVIHYPVAGRTATNTQNVLRYMANNNLGCMCMDENGVIYIPEGFDIWKHAASHAGVSKHGSRTSLTYYYMGIEVGSWGRSSTKNEARGQVKQYKAKENIIAGWYQEFTPKQILELQNFCRWAKSKNPNFKFENVVGHDELRAWAGRKGDKQDPGGALTMTMNEFRKSL